MLAADDRHHLDGSGRDLRETRHDPTTGDNPERRVSGQDAEDTTDRNRVSTRRSTAGIAVANPAPNSTRIDGDGHERAESIEGDRLEHAPDVLTPS